MVVDTSAALAILFAEADALDYANAMEAAPQRLMSNVTAFECTMVAFARGGDSLLRSLDQLLFEADIDFRSFDAAQSAIARDAFIRFGKGNHPARLNFGDCCSYALSKMTATPLLFKGADFRLTDVVPAL